MTVNLERLTVTAHDVQIGVAQTEPDVWFVYAPNVPGARDITLWCDYADMIEAVKVLCGAVRTFMDVLEEAKNAYGTVVLNVKSAHAEDAADVIARADSQRATAEVSGE